MDDWVLSVTKTSAILQGIDGYNQSVEINNLSLKKNA